MPLPSPTYLPKFWENIIENSPDAIVAIRKGGEVIIFNRAAERLLGYDQGSVVGRMNIAQFRTLIIPLICFNLIARSMTINVNLILLTFSNVNRSGLC